MLDNLRLQPETKLHDTSLLVNNLNSLHPCIR